MDPRQKSEIDKRFIEQNMIIDQLRNENAELNKALHDRDMELSQIKEQTDQNARNQRRDTSLKEKKKHNKILKSKNREIAKLKTEISSISKNLASIKANSINSQQIKSEKEKDRLKISDLLRQRSGLESQLSNLKSEMFSKNKQITDQKSEIEKLKKQISDLKSK